MEESDAGIGVVGVVDASDANADAVHNSVTRLCHEATTLAQWFASCHFTASSTCLALSCRHLADVALGLAHLHQHRVLHLAVRPDHVLLFQEGAALTGLASSVRAAPADGRGVAHVSCTAWGYASPEQVVGTCVQNAADAHACSLVSEVSPGADVWALGVLVATAAAGQVARHLVVKICEDAHDRALAICRSAAPLHARNEQLTRLRGATGAQMRRALLTYMWKWEPAAPVLAVAEACLQINPANRPSAASVGHLLQECCRSAGARKQPCDDATAHALGLPRARALQRLKAPSPPVNAVPAAVRVAVGWFLKGKRRLTCSTVGAPDLAAALASVRITALSMAVTLLCLPGPGAPLGFLDTFKQCAAAVCVQTGPESLHVVVVDAGLWGWAAAHVMRVCDSMFLGSVAVIVVHDGGGAASDSVSGGASELPSGSALWTADVALMRQASGMRRAVSVLMNHAVAAHEAQCGSDALALAAALNAFDDFAATEAFTVLRDTLTSLDSQPLAVALEVLAVVPFFAVEVWCLLDARLPPLQLKHVAEALFIITLRQVRCSFSWTLWDVVMGSASYLLAEALLLSDMTSEARCAAVMGKSLLPKRHPLRIPLKAVTVTALLHMGHVMEAMQFDVCVNKHEGSASPQANGGSPVFQNMLLAEWEARRLAVSDMEVSEDSAAVATCLMEDVETIVAAVAQPGLLRSGALLAARVRVQRLPQLGHMSTLEDRIVRLQEAGRASSSILHGHHPVIADCQQLLGHELFYAGRFIEAHAAYEASSNIWQTLLCGTGAAQYGNDTLPPWESRLTLPSLYKCALNAGLALHRAAQGAPDAAGAASLRRQQLETYKTLLLHTQQAYAPSSDQVAVCHERLAVTFYSLGQYGGALHHMVLAALESAIPLLKVSEVVERRDEMRPRSRTPDGALFMRRLAVIAVAADYERELCLPALHAAADIERELVCSSPASRTGADFASMVLETGAALDGFLGPGLWTETRMLVRCKWLLACAAPSFWPHQAPDIDAVCTSLRHTLEALWRKYLGLDHKKGALHCIRVHICIAKPSAVADAAMLAAMTSTIREAYAADPAWQAMQRAAYAAMISSAGVPETTRDLLSVCARALFDDADICPV